MRHNFCAALLAGVLLFLVSAGANASLLYRISGTDIQQPSYLFGTMHMICERDFNVDDRILQAFRATDRLVLELDLTDMAVAQQLQQSVRQPGGPYLHKHLTAEQLKEVDAALQQITGQQFSYFQELRPFVLSSMLLRQQLNCQQLASWEGFFLQQAQRTEKTVIGLETVADQISIFDRIPLARQSQWFWQMIDEFEQSSADLQQMKDLFLEEDVDKLYEFIVQQPEFAEYRPILLDDRNQNWVLTLQPLLAERPTFIAVGAGHLGGAQGLISLLRDAGYIVEPVTVAAAQ
ncbi:hypothetical protein IDSA_03900 [Pseudidiomarina salinarum]|uniref:Polysaccharide biosynthesis protein GumN n=1 Tax=Pseudidiomarina salinarum TaxID=435908 RepID=A0A094IXM3_9GAMM|nr:TraB/GumN family protein [Pseudidiomarina salinarum]KFZ31837.1 hypothetical protein IDSA_03900 [Pseudidiomarina salinarum]RUO70392.1 TraB/GumN family protein [Pseudidiomarina salinarum]